MQGVSVCTIKTNANVCCVQFPSDTGNSLAFGSADHRIYFYDLRNPSGPLYTLVGHERTVSYVRFLDSTTLVSSSTDNTLKLWDLSECSSEVLDNEVDDTEQFVSSVCWRNQTSSLVAANSMGDVKLLEMV
ncbi:WD40 repeat-containing protein [Cynara cardunculus var. scolymus]|uniref:WD40 repeat-containing protein n=1 Tax=Cynara cardunculus var. scolymus TaxID=59895 RepID=A0A118K139_CYNCS|nr:WD40 repeat-containing protein [Cynara cardunculus var. scolymus]